MADQIIVLDGDEEEESPKPCCSASLKSQQPVPTHITKSPFASAKKNTHVLQAENSKLFTEFVEHCSSITQDCPKIVTFLQTRHSKASPDYLSSVEFRNTLGSCLTRVQKNRSKTYVYIQELCTELQKHSAKRRQMTTKVECGPCTSTPSSHQSASVDRLNQAAEDKQPSNSGLQEDDKEDQEAEKKANRATRKQIAYLDNLLKVYHDEIRRLQQAELSLDDLDTEDSSYIQENKLKRKMMKIYEKLCELKGCSKLTGRAIEQRIRYSDSRHPKINKRIERFINRPEAHRHPPNFKDIRKQVESANKRYSLHLTPDQLKGIAEDAFRVVATRVQERRHCDLLLNFGSHLTDSYKASKDPALFDPSLLERLKSNEEVAKSRLEEVIDKYASKQEDAEEQERMKRLEKSSKEREGCTSEEKEENKGVNGVAEEEEEDEEEEEEEEEEEDESSDPDIEAELQASNQQDGPDDDENEDDGDKAEQACDGTDKDAPTAEGSGSVSAQEEDSMKDETEEPITNGLGPLSDESNFQISPLSDIPSPEHSPSQSEPMQTDDQRPLSNGSLAGLEEPVDSSGHVSTVSANESSVTPVAANRAPWPPSPEIVDEKCDTRMTTNSGTSTSSRPRALRGRKRKREEMTSGNPIDIHDSEADIPLDMGVVSCSSPQRAESTRAKTPILELVTSSQSTPPPKKNKVNVSTQCDPDEIIVLSDSE